MKFLMRIIILISSFYMNQLTYAQSNHYVLNGNDSGTGSLRQLLLEAASGDTIRFPDDIDTVGLTSGELLIDKSLVVEGNPGRTCILRADTTLHFRIFNIESPESIRVELNDLCISSGKAPGGNDSDINGQPGGGICIPDSIHEIVLKGCAFEGNMSGIGHRKYGVNKSGNGGNGGGIYSLSRMTLENCIINENLCGNGADASSGGGGDWNSQSAGDGGSGGGIYCLNDLALSGCTISQNHSGNGGDAHGVGHSLGGDGGDGGHGGAISTKKGHVNIDHSMFNENSSGNGGYAGNSQTSCSGGIGGNGGALYFSGSYVLMNNSEILNNFTGKGASGSGNEYGFGGDGGSGGGMYAFNSSFIASFVMITSNYTGKGGSSDCASVLRFPGNGGNGGGVCLEKCIATFEQSSFSENHSGTGAGVSNANFQIVPGRGNGGSGGGIFINEPVTHSLIYNCSIDNNYTGNGGICASSTYHAPESYASGGNGGGIALSGSDSLFRILNCVISGNYCGNAVFKNEFLPEDEDIMPQGGSGGGIYLFQASHLIINSTIANNCAGTAVLESKSQEQFLNVPDYLRGQGGGVFNEDSIVLAINSIIAKNHLLEYSVKNDIEGEYALHYSLLSTDTLSSVISGTENLINIDPQFLSFPGDLSLSQSSLAINHGSPDTTGLFLPESDLASNPRIYGERIDMGAYEYQGEPQDQYIISTYEIEMDSVIVGGFAVDSLSIRNYGLTALNITDIQTDSPFSLSLDKTNWTYQLGEVSVPTGEPFTSLTVYIKFEGLVPGFHSNNIVITIGDISSYIQVSGFCKSTEGMNEDDGKISLSISPNPFNKETRISFYLEEAGDVNLSVYNSSGLKVDEIILQFQPEGLFSFCYKNKNLTPGMYFMEIQTGITTLAAKILVTSH